MNGPGSIHYAGNFFSPNVSGGIGKPAIFFQLQDTFVLQNNLNRIFDDDFWGFNGSVSPNPIPVNIRETDKSYELEFIAPGLTKQEFNLQIANDLLTVSFEHKQESGGQDNKAADTGAGWLRREYIRQSFTRSFNLDDSVNAEKASARYENGVLYLSLPKKEHAQKVSRAIEVK